MRVFFRQLLRDARCEQNIESPVDHDVVLSKQRSIVVVSFEVVLVETEEGLAGLQAIYLGELILFGWVELNIVSFITPVHSNLLLLHLVVFKSFEDQPVEFYLAEVVFRFVREVVFHVESKRKIRDGEAFLWRLVEPGKLRVGDQRIFALNQMTRFQAAECTHDSEEHYGAENASPWANIFITVKIERVYRVREHIETVY